MTLPFTKMHGAGNDFVFLNGITQKLPQNLSEFSKQICDRRFGVGADQVLIVQPSSSHDFRMDIFNADGGQVEMCGNGIRCFAKYVHDQNLVQKNEIRVETLAGTIIPQILRGHALETKNTWWVKVDMGEPILDAEKIPTHGKGKLLKSKLTLESKPAGVEFVELTGVSMGNPHAVIFVSDNQSYPVTTVGPAVETHSFFPKRTNVEFVTVKSRTHLSQRTWERGSGETYACGTGASAVAVAAVLNGLADRRVTISLKGGDLELFWDESNNHVYKTGPATTVFEGVWTL